MSEHTAGVHGLLWPVLLDTAAVQKVQDTLITTASNHADVIWLLPISELL